MSYSTVEKVEICFNDVTKQLSSDKFYIGYSGGLDSSVLLYLAAKFLSKKSSVIAIHYNHGINKDSNKWSTFCKRQCESLEVGCLVVDLDFGSLKNFENKARDARREGFVKLCPKGSNILLAHHLEDQAETILFRLVRGTGVLGAKGMEVVSSFNDLKLVRPLLNVSKEDLRIYAKEKNIEWVEDPSNIDISMDRNYIRQEIIPRLKSRWPRVSHAFSSFGKKSAETSTIADRYILKDHGHRLCAISKSIDVSDCDLMPEDELCHLLRLALQRFNIYKVTYSQIQNIIKDVILAKEDKNPILLLDKAIVRRYRDKIFVIEENVFRKDVPRVKIAIKMNQNYLIDGIGNLEVVPKSMDIIIDEELVLDYNCWGKTGKKIFQLYGVPPWIRGNYPLLFYKGSLVSILGLWNRPETKFEIKLASI